MSTKNPTTLHAVPDPAKPRTATEEKLWQTLLNSPGSTASDLAIAADIGKSTAGKILARWEKERLATRISGIADGGLRSADRWSITTTDAPNGDDPTGDPSENAPADNQDSDETAEPDPEPTSKRLSPGVLRGMVEDHLRNNPGEDFGPHAIGKALERSSGAVHNALEKLVENGYAVRTSDKPKKYSLAPTPSASPTR